MARQGRKKPGKMTAAERASLVRTQPSMEFEGKWEETVYSLEYIRATPASSSCTLVRPRRRWHRGLSYLAAHFLYK